VTYWLHPDAERDIADALDFYTERAAPLVAQRFLIESERVASLLVEHPGLGTPTTRGRRVFPLRVTKSTTSTTTGIFSSMELRMASSPAAWPSTT